jgi:succinate-semialdehyde dehydrogenase/glutarate-semialdehyde dehydrogenase
VSDVTTAAVRTPHDIVDRSLIDTLIDGIVASPRADRHPIVAPFTGTPLAELPLSTPDDVASAYDAARTAQRAWADRPLRERARIIGRVHDLVLDRQSALADLIQAESGKARRDAFEEIGDVALAARYCAVRGPQVLRDRRRKGLAPGLTKAIEVRHPKGVIGVISPFNYPLTLAISDSLPAFVAGNAVVHKPDLQAVLTALMARAIAIEAGLPEGLWQIVSGDGPGIGGAVVDRADFVSFTGSTAVGRQISARAGERLVGATLELGGKNPMVVLDDANLDRAAECAVRACFSNAGQLCISVERLYLAAPIRDAFMERFLSRIGELRLGAGFDYRHDVGSLVSQAQLDKTKRHVDDAVTKGAEVLVGGKPRPDLGPWFYEPTVLRGVRRGMLAADDETFGPVVSVYQFSTDDEAVSLANDSLYGLNASVWSRDIRRGIAVARRIRAGAVNVNEAYGATWGSHDLPSGGTGASGLGRRHGRDGILRYTEPQAIAAQRVHGITPLPWHDSYDQFAKVMTASMRMLRRLRLP